jgi:hypothetical protein
MTRSLYRAFTQEEVNTTLFQIDDLKVPGPDGLHAVL